MLLDREGGKPGQSDAFSVDVASWRQLGGDGKTSVYSRCSCSGKFQPCAGGRLYAWREAPDLFCQIWCWLVMILLTMELQTSERALEGREAARMSVFIKTCVRRASQSRLGGEFRSSCPDRHGGGRERRHAGIEGGYWQC
jgi:hypothetical protein